MLLSPIEYILAMDNIEEIPGELSNADNPILMHTLQEDGSLIFSRTEVHINLRQRMSDIKFQTCWDDHFLITLITGGNADKFCNDYAFDTIFAQYNLWTPVCLVFNMPKNEVIEESFQRTKTRKKGNLACYYSKNDLQRPVHFALDDGDGYLISKWGTYGVYRHLPFCDPPKYGDIIVFYEYIGTR